MASRHRQIKIQTLRWPQAARHQTLLATSRSSGLLPPVLRSAACGLLSVLSDQAPFHLRAHHIQLPGTRSFPQVCAWLITSHHSGFSSNFTSTEKSSDQLTPTSLTHHVSSNILFIFSTVLRTVGVTCFSEPVRPNQSGSSPQALPSVRLTVTSLVQRMTVCTLFG